MSHYQLIPTADLNRKHRSRACPIHRQKDVTLMQVDHPSGWQPWNAHEDNERRRLQSGVRTA